VKANSFRFCIG